MAALTEIESKYSIFTKPNQENLIVHIIVVKSGSFLTKIIESYNGLG